MNAIEIALQLKETHGGQILLLSMGPPFFESYLRVALSMGADQIYLLSDHAFAGADTLATTYTLAKAIQKIGKVDLILCGEESADGATGQVPAGLAEWLDIPQITMVNEVQMDPEGEWVRGRRESRGGYEILQSPLPAVISVKTAVNEPRFMDFSLKRWALEEAQVSIWDSTCIEADEDKIGWQGSPTIVAGLKEAEIRDRRREFLIGSLDEVTQTLTQILKETR
jgi:electron transfer flavoprotein beta subunit